MATSVINWFKAILLVQLFFSFGITVYTYSIPDEAKDYVTSFSDLSERITLEDVSDDVQSSLSRQTNLPVIEFGALLFYSGNIILDLLLNFIFAIPEMITLTINGILLLFEIPNDFINPLQVFISVSIMAMYIIAIIQLLTSIRSGRLV